MAQDLLGAADKLLARNSPEPAGGTPFANDSQLQRGLRSGVLGAGSQLAALGGAGASALGLDPTAAFDASDALGLRAAETAPRVGSYKDVHGLRDALDYGAGVLGQSAPIGAAALGAGALAGPLGAAAVMTPTEAGDVVMRQREQGQPTDLGAALGTGAISAGLQSIVPAVAGAKLAGKAGALVAEGGLGNKVAKNLLAVPGEAATNVAGEAAKQIGSGQGLNEDALKEAGVGGLVGGLPFAGAGVLGDTLSSGRAVAGKALKGAGDALKGAGTEALDTSGKLAAGAKEATASAADKVMDFYDRKVNPANDAPDRVMQGKPLQDDPAYANTPADSPTYQGLLDKLDGDHVAEVMKWGKDMLAAGKDKVDGWLTPERKAQVEEAMGDLGDAGNRAKIAALEKGRQAAEAATGMADSLMTKVKDWAGAKDEGSTKKSEDYSGIRKVISDEVTPVIQETSPGLLDDPKGMSTLADGLRVFMEHAARTERKALPPDVSRSLFDVMGDKTIPTLRKLYRAVQGENSGNTASTEAFFSTLNDMMAQRKSDTKLYDVMSKSLKSEFQKTTTTTDLRAEADHLSEWAARPAKDSAQDKVDSSLIRDRLTERYGSKADAVLDAIERSRKPEVNELGEPGFEGAPPEGEVTRAFPRKTPMTEDEATSYIANLERKHPEYQGRFVSADEYADMKGVVDPKWVKEQRTLSKLDDSDKAKQAYRGGADNPNAVPNDHGFVVAERIGGTDALDKAGLSDMRFKGGAGADDRRTSPRALVTNAEKPGTDLLDSVAMTKAMRTSQPYQDGEVNGNRRDARMFKEAVSRATEKLGRSFKVPDKTVINEGGLTWGKAKELTNDRGPSPEDRALQKMRDNYREAKTNGDGVLMKEIENRAARLLDARDRSISGDDIEALRDGSEVRATPRFDEEGKYIGEQREKIKIEQAAREYLQTIGKDSADAKNDNVHLAAATLKPNELQIKTGMDEQSLSKSTRPSAEGMRGALDSAIARMEVGRKFDNAKQDFIGPVNKAAQVVASKARILQQHFDEMKPMDQASLLSVIKAKSVSESASAINALFNKYGDMPTKAAPEVAAQSPKARLEQRAHSGDPSLLKEIGAHNDAGQLQRAVDHLNTVKDKNPQTLKAIDALNERMGQLVKDNPDTAYNLLRESAQKTDPNAKVSAQHRAEVKDYLDKVLGAQVKRQWSKIMHAGEFDAATETIRISVHALNPLSAAHHEAMHAFFEKMRQANESGPMSTLFKAADSSSVRRQLERLLSSEPDALKQLNDPEERAAYMYQFWAKGDLKLGDNSQGVLSKLAGFFRNVLRLWSNDEKAQHIMDYFHQGEFNKDPSSLASLKDIGNNRALTTAKAMAEPLSRLSDTVFTAGSQRLRDTNIPALQALADTMKPRSTDTKADPGFIAAARIERTAAMNKIGQRLAMFDKGEINEALEALQRGDVDSASTPKARSAGRLVRRSLDEMFDYMRGAGVRVNDLGVGKDYFPRVYDTDYISRHQKDFQTVLEKHGIAQPERIIRNLMSAEGNEFQIETMKPGMQHVKPRVLKNIPDAELSRFTQKDLFSILNSYTTQATRRGEWARRFNDDGSGLTKMLDTAKGQGATPDQLKTAENYVRGIDGTLGDHINPTARRLFGNMIVYQNIRLLPLAIFSSVVDPAGIAVRGGTVGDAWSTFKRGIKEIKKNFGGDKTADQSTQLAETMGVIDNAALVHSLGALYSQGMVGGTARKINDTFFRYNLMEQFNTSMRVGAMEAAMKFMQRHADGTASVHSERWMKELGIQKGDIKTTPGGHMAMTESDGLNPDQAARVRIATNRWVDGAVLRPDAADKPIWMNDPHWALVAHLKQFVYSFHETILKRVVHEFEHGNYTPAMALASYVPIMIAADALKGLIQGGGQQPEWKDKWGPGDYLWSGVERAGLLGTGQFRADMLDDVVRGGTGIGALTGPTIEQMTDAVRTMDGREAFKHFALKSMPANALYANLMGGPATDPKFAD